MGVTAGPPPPKPQAVQIIKKGDDMNATDSGDKKKCPHDSNKCKKGGCVMNKVYCAMFGFAMMLGFGSFLIDWVDVTKNRDDSRVEFYINTGKIGEDVNSAYEKVCDFFNG